jgi:LacI family transcriptional regulator
MKRLKTPTLGIVTNNPGGEFQRDIIAGASLIAQQRGYEVQVLVSPQRTRPTFTVEGLTGMLVVSNCVPDDYLLQIYKTGIPLSLASHQLNGVPVPSLSPDNIEGVQLLVRHLVETCQRQRIVFIQGDLSQNDGIRRDLTFRRELMRYNLPIVPDFFLRGDFEPSTAVQSLEALLKQRRDFDAVIASDYIMALAILPILAQAGLRVPEEVCVVGFGDAPKAEEAGLTTVAADVVELGKRAARQLIGQIDGLDISGLTLISSELIVRRTTC